VEKKSKKRKKINLHVCSNFGSSENRLETWVKAAVMDSRYFVFDAEILTTNRKTVQPNSAAWHLAAVFVSETPPIRIAPDDSYVILPHEPHGDTSAPVLHGLGYSKKGYDDRID
jgi:hypothetical protein